MTSFCAALRDSTEVALPEDGVAINAHWTIFVIVFSIPISVDVITFVNNSSDTAVDYNMDTG